MLVGNCTAHPILHEIEAMAKHYIKLKTLVSALTGVAIGVILTMVCWGSATGVLGPVFGLLAFVLNYVPNIGSVIAVILPLPVILLDPDLSVLQRVLAVALPAAIEGYIGNVMEPQLFGELKTQWY